MDSPSQLGEEIILPENESIHISRVLRMQKGDKLEALDGRGGRFSAECLEINRSKVRVRILGIDQIMPALPEIRMVIALGKGNKWEELIRPLTELGVSQLIPLITDRTEGVFESGKLADKKERWQKIAQEACKQSGNTWMPKFDDPIHFEDQLTKVEKEENCWMGSLRTDAIKLSPSPACRQLSIYIGPEGGWSLKEEENARKSGFDFFTLGDHVLRVDTAAVCALAVARNCML